MPSQWFYTRFLQALGAGERQQDLKEKAGQARDIDPLAGQVSGNERIRMANGPASSN